MSHFYLFVVMLLKLHILLTLQVTQFYRLEVLPKDYKYFVMITSYTKGFDQFACQIPNISIRLPNLYRNKCVWCVTNLLVRILSNYYLIFTISHATSCDTNTILGFRFSPAGDLYSTIVNCLINLTADRLKEKKTKKQNISQEFTCSPRHLRSQQASVASLRWGCDVVVEGDESTRRCGSARCRQRQWVYLSMWKWTSSEAVSLTADEEVVIVVWACWVVPPFCCHHNSQNVEQALCAVTTAKTKILFLFLFICQPLDQSNG